MSANANLGAMTAVLLAGAGLLAGCDKTAGNPVDPAAQAPATDPAAIQPASDPWPNDPAVQAKLAQNIKFTDMNPGGVEQDSKVHWSFDPSGPEEVYPVVNDDAAHELFLPATAQGIGIVYRDVGGANPIQLASTAFNYLPLAVMAPDGRVLACWTRFTGQPNEQTGGTMPDPREGADLVCRFKPSGGEFGPELKIEHNTKLAYFSNVEWDATGLVYVLDYTEDPFGTFFSIQTQDFRRTFDGVQFSAPYPTPADDDTP